MSSQITQKIIETLESKELTDFKFLISEEALNETEKALNLLLENAKKSFENLQKTSLEEVSFDSVVLPYLNADETLYRLYGLLHQFNMTDSSDAIRKIIENVQPKMVEYSNTLSLDETTYNFFKHLEKTEFENLTSSQKRSLLKLIEGKELSGVHLSEEKKEKIRSINQKLAKLSNDFGNNVIDHKQEFFYQFKTNEDLKELPEEDLEAAKSEAEKRNLEGWVFTLMRSSYDAIVKYCTNREVRKKFFNAYLEIGYTEKYDNRPLILEMLKLRKERAELFDCKSHAEKIVKRRMASSPEEIINFQKEISEKAYPKALEDVTVIKEFSGLDDFSQSDFSFYTRKYIEKTFNVDPKLVKQYFPLNQVLEGLFEISKKLYDVELKELQVDSYHEDIKNYEVYRNGNLIGYFVLDAFSRPTKQPGAWCNHLREYLETEDTKILPIAINVCNFPKPTKETPSLLSIYNVSVIFHEFGHALHLLLSQQEYSNISGGVEWDFIELPSQLMENWMNEKESFANFAKHYETGEPMPKELIDSIEKKRFFLEAYVKVMQNNKGLLDMELHSEKLPKTNEELEAVALKYENQYSFIDEASISHRYYTQFTHLFNGGYSAGYYSYLWAEVLEADVFSRFKEKGLFDKETANLYAEKILSQGSIKPADELFKDFMGREPSPKALLERLGIE